MRKKRRERSSGLSSGRLSPIRTAALPAVATLLLTAATAGVAQEGGLEGRRLVLRVRDSFLPGIPLLVRVELREADGRLARSVWDAEARLSVEPGNVAIEPDSLALRNGVGSVLAALADASGARLGVDRLTLTARLGELEVNRTLESLEGRPVRPVSGTLAPGTVEWSGVVRVTGDTTVPAGTTLRVLPGTLVLVDGVASGENGSDINIEGTIESLGTAERPVTFTASVPSEPWGELDHEGAQPSLYRHTHVTRAGHSPRGGHTNTGPAVRPRGGSEITFEFSTFSDNAGKVMQAQGAELEFFECLLSRSVMGPEIDNTALIFESSYITEMHGQDDNDGIYLHSQSAGQLLAIVSSIVADGDDDGIDTLGSEVIIRDCIVRDFDDKGISVFHNEVSVSRCLIADNDIGISAKTGNDRVVTVNVDTSTLAGNRIALQAENKRGQAPRARIVYQVNSCILRHSGAPEARTVRTDYDPRDVNIRYSDVEDDWPGVENIADDPGFLDAGSRDFRLESGSPCIDRGDPELDRDPDGSRADMGVFPFGGEPSRLAGFVRGRVNGDDDVDISDAVTLLLHLFPPAAGGPSIPCREAADVDASGQLNLADSILLLNHLFLEGPPPKEPFTGCGGPPVVDGLGCDRPHCLLEPR